MKLKLSKIFGLSLIVFLLFTLTNITVLAQSNLTKPIVVDGSEIFRVQGYELFPAETRADWTNVQIQEVIESEEKPKVRVEQKNQSPIIVLNERYLLTVTDKDRSKGKTIQQQAEIWAENIRISIEQAQKERSKSYIIRRLLFTFIALVWAIACHWFFGKSWRKSKGFWLKILHIEEAESSSPEYQGLNLFLNLTLISARITVWISIFLYITNLFPVTKVWSYRLRNALIQGFSSPLLEIGGKSYSVINFVILIGLLILLFFASNTLSNLVKTKILSLTQINRGVKEAITFFIKYTILSVSTVVILQVWGFDLSSLTIFASAIGVAIGFGFQDIAKNFGSGLVLLFERPIQVGDFVEIGNYMGSIENIGARSTLIKTLDQVSIIVPNSRFLEEEVINWSHNNPISRLHLVVGVAYNSDLKLAREALLESVKECHDISPFPPPDVFCKGFGDSAIDFELLVWIQDPAKQMKIKSDLYFAIEASFQQYNIEIPFPQTDLHFQLSSELENKLNQILKKNN